MYGAIDGSSACGTVSVHGAYGWKFRIPRAPDLHAQDNGSLCWRRVKGLLEIKRYSAMKRGGSNGWSNESAFYTSLEALSVSPYIVAKSRCEVIFGRFVPTWNLIRSSLVLAFWSHVT